MRFVIIGCLSWMLSSTLWAQSPKEALTGRWEDDASTSSNFYQLVVNKDHMAFLRVPQAKILDKLSMPRKTLNTYRWVDDRHVRYSKLPDQNPLRAKQNPPKHSLMRVDSIVKDLMYVTLSDNSWLSKDLDSILKASENWRPLFSDRKVRYRRLNLAKQLNRARLLGLWEDRSSKDSTSLQFYVEKGIFGFSKVEAKDAATPTAIKPNSGYHYHWITDNILYYRRQEQTGYSATPRNKNPNVYVLMRIDQLDRNTLKVTLSARPFDEAGLDYIKEENQLNTYFQKDEIIYRRIPIVEPPSDPDS
ncbi:MAG: hypothetical protein ACRBFS_05440 [Aureispira sp.]